MVDVGDGAGDAGCTPINLRRNPDSSAASQPFSDSSVARGAQTVNTIAAPPHDKFPDLPKTASTKGGQFSLTSQGYQLTIDGGVTYARGWIAQIIKLGDTVPATTGGNIGKDFGAGGSGPSFSGSDWRYAKADTHSPSGFSFWDGSAWQNVPSTWSDPTATKMCGNALWMEQGQLKSQYGNSWPDKLPDWSDDDKALLAQKLPRWKNGIESGWSGVFDLRRKECPSNDPGCCRYQVKVTADFVELPAQDAAIVLAPNFARSNFMVWSLAEPRDSMPVHEFGHHLGYPDEYVGGINIDTTVNEDGAVNGIDVDSIMGQNATNVKKRHFRVVCQQLSAMVDTASGRTNGFTYQAVPPQ